MIKIVAGCWFFIASLITSASAEENAPVARGTAGLIDVPFRADNEGAGEMGCSVALAHWYSAELGKAAAGGNVHATLWYDPKDGNVLMLNASEDHMPVQMLWCGTGPRSWRDRAVIRLERKAGTVPAPIHVVCRPSEERLVCR